MKDVQELFEQALTNAMTSCGNINKVVGELLHEGDNTVDEDDDHSDYSEKTMLYHMLNKQGEQISNIVCSFYAHQGEFPFRSIRVGFGITTPNSVQTENAYYEAVQQMNLSLNSGSCQMIINGGHRWAFACDFSIIPGQPESVIQRCLDNFIQILPKASMFFEAMDTVNSFLAFTESMVDEDGNFDVKQAVDALTEMTEQHTVH